MDGSPIIIAEIGSNWKPGNLESALAMIRVAKECGADWVKFQDFRVDNMDRPESWKERCRPWELAESWLPSLMDEAMTCDMQLLCSVWDGRSVLRAFGMFAIHYPVIKVAASEIGNQPLLRDINRRSVPLFREGGMNAVKVLLSADRRKHGAVVPALTWLPDCAITLLHCVSEYPATDIHERRFHELKEFGLPVGWSSHVGYPEAVGAATEFAHHGATVIEVHLRTEETPNDAPDNGPWSLFPHEFKELVDEVRRIKGKER